VNASAVAEWVLIVGSIIGIGSGAVAIFQARSAKRQLDAQAKKITAESDKLSTDRAATINEMALKMLDPMQRRIESLTAEVARLETEVHRLTDRLKLAQHLLTEHDIPFPPLDG